MHMYHVAIVGGVWSLQVSPGLDCINTLQYMYKLCYDLERCLTEYAGARLLVNSL